VAAGDQRADQVVPDLATGTGDEDLHGRRIIDRTSSVGKPPGSPCAVGSRARLTTGARAAPPRARASS